MARLTLHSEETPMEFLDFEDAIELIHMEYAEMPGLRLTFSQARRMWNLTDAVCERALGALTASGFLEQRRDGTYVRTGSSTASILQSTGFAPRA
jgi:hypothetical protein